jgi:hypothetical protein
MLVDDRRLRPRATERGAGREDELKVFVRLSPADVGETGDKIGGP